VGRPRASGHVSMTAEMRVHCNFLYFFCLVASGGGSEPYRLVEIADAEDSISDPSEILTKRAPPNPHGTMVYGVSCIQRDISGHSGPTDKVAALRAPCPGPDSRFVTYSARPLRIRIQKVISICHAFPATSPDPSKGIVSSICHAFRATSPDSGWKSNQYLSRIPSDLSGPAREEL
jgi:hypothetical protein